MIIELFDDINLKLTALTEETKKFISGFNCGNSTINNYLKYNGTCLEVAKTYILIDQKTCKTIGFFSLCADTLLVNDGYGIIHSNPAIRINMFAVDINYQRKRKISIDGNNVAYAHFLLIQCFSIIKSIVKKHIGAAYIIVYSTKEGLNLYKHIGKFNIADDEYMVSKSIDDKKLTPMYRDIFDYD